MQFGVYLRPMVTYNKMLELAEYAEDEGFFGVFLNDHVQSLENDGKEPYLEAWTAMSGIGVQTRRIRVGHITLFNSLRNPAYLAKSITALDVMTKGRYETIIGAGWNEPEYVGYDLMEKGRGMPSAGERVTRLKEAVQILQGMLNRPVFNFKGRYWNLKEAINIPQPIQKPMKISIGARQPRMIRIAAKYGDGINVSGGLDNISRIINVLKPALKANGKTSKDFMISGFASISIAKDENEYNLIVKKEAVKTLRSVDEVKADAFSGTPEILIEKYREAQDLGMKLMILISETNNLEESKQTLAWLKDEIAGNI